MKISRSSSVLVSWVKWKSSVMNVQVKLCPGCNHGPVVTYHVRNSRKCKSNVWPSKSSNATCANTCNCVPGHGGNCGRRSSLCSMLHVLKMKLLYVYKYFLLLQLLLYFLNLFLHLVIYFYIFLNLFLYFLNLFLFLIFIYLFSTLWCCESRRD